MSSGGQLTRLLIASLMITICIIGGSPDGEVRAQSVSKNGTNPAQINQNLRPSNTTINRVPLRNDSSLMDKNAEESISSSVVNSFYNLLNNTSIEFQARDEAKAQNISAQKKKSARQLGEQVDAHGQEQLMFHQPYNLQALGGEHLAHVSGLADTIYPSHLEVSNANQNYLVQPPAIYEQPLALQPSQDHVIAQFIVDPTENQQIIDIRPTYPEAPQGPRQQHAASDIYGAQQGRQMGSYHPHQGLHRMISADRVQQQRQNSEAVEQNLQDPEESKLNKNKLSNEQLMTLIDELKEFNSRQASKMLANEVVAAQPAEQVTKPAEERENESEPPEEQTEDIHKELENVPPASHEPAENVKEKAPELNNEELKKFAKFLLSKEGSNMKFQLGLEKDSPDDGDDDDEKDSLLETTAKQTKAPLGKRRKKKPFPKELDDLDKKHKEVSSNMDKIIEDMTGFAQKANPKRRRKRPKKDDDDDFLRARARRNSKRAMQNDSNASGDSRPREVSARWKEAPDSSSLDRNFAKMLLNQEMQQDKYDADRNDSGLGQNEYRDNSMRRAVYDHTDHMKSSRKKRRSSDYDSQPSEQVSEGEDYPKRERNGDHIALIHELQAARKAKGKLRARVPISSDPLVQRALDSELGVRSETQPNGDVLIRSNKDESVALRVPKKKLDGESGRNRPLTHTSHDNGDSGRKVDIKSNNLIDEYPVSERVSDRLNKLSRNLDKYFNDNFLQEIEAKSGSPETTDKQSAADENGSESADNLSSEVLEPNIPQKIGGVQVDPDFDVDVGIDGKRDFDKINDDGDDDDDDDRQRSGNPSVKRDKQAKKTNKPPKEERPLENVEPKTSKHKKQSIAARAQKEIKPVESESRQGSSSTDLSAGKDNLEFDNLNGLTPNLDPVDGETMDTPIGPDSNNSEPVPFTVRNKIQSSRISDKTSKNYGKKAESEFYKEPEWRS